MKSRRGLSTVVGAVFFVIAATTVITYISYSMNTIDEFAQSVIVSEAENINRGMEDISISQATLVGGEFNATVINTGSLPVQLTRLWVVNEDTGLNSKADLDERINPGNQIYNIGVGAGISADSTTSYTLKAVTSRGNIATFSVSPNISTQVQIIIPGEVQPGESFRVVTLITNNSTQPNNIVDLVPIIKNNSTLTQIDGPLPPSIKTLPRGNTATFTSTYVAPDLPTGILFNATYTGAPTSALTNSNMSVAIAGESEAATNSAWSQAASRVGILISGIPNPVDAGSTNKGKYGIGIINPLDRNVSVYAVGVSHPNKKLLETAESDIDGAEPTTGWRGLTLGNVENLVLWEGGTSPIIITPKSVGQFRVEIEHGASGTTEALTMIHALTSEGKMTALYSMLASTAHATINTFYTNNTSDPLNNWGYLIKDIPSGRTNQIFNATLQNASNNIHQSPVQMIILVPSDFTNIIDVTNGTGGSGWNTASIVANPDKSHVITVQTSADTLGAYEYWTYQFSANAPAVSDPQLYVMQTTTVYPDFNSGEELQLASALSEAGVSVIP